MPKLIPLPPGAKPRKPTEPACRATDPSATVEWWHGAPRFALCGRIRCHDGPHVDFGPLDNPCHVWETP